MATKTKKFDWQLAPAPESKDHVKIHEQYELYQRQVGEAEILSAHQHHRPVNERALPPRPVAVEAICSCPYRFGDINRYTCAA